VEQPSLKGSFPARIVQIVFLGVQDQRAYQGQAKPPVEKVRITYELSHEFMQDEEGVDQEDQPRWYSETIPFLPASSDLATSTKRFKVYRPDVVGLDEYVWDETLLSTPVQLTLDSRKVDKGQHAGKTFTDVKGCTPMSKMPGYVQPELANPEKQIFFDPFDTCDIEVFNSLPEWLQGEIRGAHNFAQSELAKFLLSKTSPPKEVEEREDREVEEVPSDDNPY